MRNMAALGIVINSLHTRIKMFFFLKTSFHPMDHSQEWGNAAAGATGG